jgi:hypothetical protein
MSSPTVDGRAKTAKARKIHLELSAHRAVDDPVELARAARIIRAAIARRILTEDDLRGDVVRGDADAT